MRKYIYLTYLLIATFPSITFAEMENPAPGLFIDLFRSGKGLNNFQSLFEAATSFLLGLVGTVSIFFIILGGFYYLTSGANADLAERGKKMVKGSIIGLIIVLLSYIIVTVVVNTLAPE